MSAWLSWLVIEDARSKCQGCFANSSRIQYSSPTQPSLSWPPLPPSRLETKMQMSDATVNVFLNHDEIQFSLLHKSHPFVGQMNMLSVHFLVLSAWVRNGAFSVLSWAGAVDELELWNPYMTRQTSKHNRTFQTPKSDDVELTDILQSPCYHLSNTCAVGPFRATESERLQATWHSPVHYREQLRIISRDGSDSPKTRHRRRRLLWEGLSW